MVLKEIVHTEQLELQECSQDTTVAQEVHKATEVLHPEVAPTAVEQQVLQIETTAVHTEEEVLLLPHLEAALTEEAVLRLDLPLQEALVATG